jgi:integrase
MRAACWPLRDWTETRDVWDAAARRYHRETRHRTLAVLTWHSLRHRFARVAIDLYGADPGMLMALGGWENEATVLNRYYRTGAEHTRRGLARFSELPECLAERDDPRPSRP